MSIRFEIYRFDPDKDSKPYMQKFDIDRSEIEGQMVLDGLLALKEREPSLAFRRACRAGVCGSDGMSINGKNGLACMTPIDSLSQPIKLRPLPGMPVIRDLVVDLTNFFRQLKKAQNVLKTDLPVPEKEYLQTPAEREKLNGLYECILCACCTSSCPSYWWNPDKFLGPAALLQAARFILDSRDTDTRRRLKDLNDAYSLFRCRGIMNCANVCPKGLNPTQAIESIRGQMLTQEV